LRLANNGRPRGNGCMRHDTIKGAPNLLATVLFSFLMRSGTEKCEVRLLVLSQMAIEESCRIARDIETRNNSPGDTVQKFRSKYYLLCSL